MALKIFASLSVAQWAYHSLLCYAVVYGNLCSRVTADSDVVWHGNVTSPDVTTFSASVHRVSGSMKYLKQVSFLIISLNSEHTQTYNCFTALWILSGTTRVSRYLKKHSPTHTNVVINHPLSASSIHYNPWHPPCSIYVPDSLIHYVSPSFIWSASWPGTSTSYSIHFFTQPLSSFRSTCRYHRNLFCCSTEIMSSEPNLSALYLELYLVASCYTSI